MRRRRAPADAESDAPGPAARVAKAAGPSRSEVVCARRVECGTHACAAHRGERDDAAGRYQRLRANRAAGVARLVSPAPRGLRGGGDQRAHARRDAHPPVALRQRLRALSRLDREPCRQLRRRQRPRSPRLPAGGPGADPVGRRGRRCRRGVHGRLPRWARSRRSHPR